MYKRQGFFHTGAYQESLGGYGGIQHCLIPAPQHVIVDRDEEGNLTTRLFAPQQNADSMLQILGYELKPKDLAEAREENLPPEPTKEDPSEPILSAEALRGA